MKEKYSIFEKILKPESIKSFEASFFRKKAVHFKGTSTKSFNWLLTISDIEKIIKTGYLSADEVHLVKDGKQLDCSKYSTPISLRNGKVKNALDPTLLNTFYSKGYSIILEKINFYLPQLQEVIQQVESRYLAKANFNLYLTNKKSQAFEYHCDNHEVLVIQLDGKKDWHILIGDKPIELTLEKGDLLLIPKGLYHKAECKDSMSVHLTLGISVLELKEILMLIADNLEDFHLNHDTKLDSISLSEISLQRNFEILKQSISLEKITSLLVKERSSLTSFEFKSDKS